MSVEDLRVDHERRLVHHQCHTILAMIVAAVAAGHLGRMVAAAAAAAAVGAIRQVHLVRRADYYYG